MIKPEVNTLIFQGVSGTIQDTIKEFLVERRSRRLSPHTVEFYMDELRYFTNYLDTINIVNLEELSPNIIRNYLIHLEASRNPGGIYGAYRAIKALLLWYEDEFEPQNWRNPIRKVKVSIPKIKPLPGVSVENIQKMVAVCDGFLEHRDRAILMCLLDTGCRGFEFVSLNIEDVNFTTGAVLVHHGKGDKERTVYLGRESRKALKRYLATRNDLSVDSPLIATDDGSRFTRNGLYEAIRKRARMANIPTPGLHDFRRCFALQMKRAGVDILNISRLLGHTSLIVTQRYLAYDNADLKEAHKLGSPVDKWRL